jgi:2-aminoadipate transaminase
VPKPFDFEARYAQRVGTQLRRVPRPAVPYDFAVGHPDASTFPSRELGEATMRMLLREGPELAIYPGDRDHMAMRELVARRVELSKGVDVPVSRITVTNGSLQGLQMIAESFIDPGDTIVVDEFTYSGALRAFNLAQPRYATVPTDEDGVVVEELARVLDDLAATGTTPKFIYVIANFQNPTGTVMSLPRRQALAALADERGLLVVDDDVYGDLLYEGEPVPPLYALSQTDNVIRLGTFSKIMAAGVRLGWLIAPEPVLSRMATAKVDGGTSSFASRAVAEYLHDHLDERVDTLLDVYRAKRDVMLQALETHLGNVATWSRPRGGLFIWVRLPEAYDTVAMLPAALAAGVDYLPGPEFSPSGRGANYLRLSFAWLMPEAIRAGIAALAGVVEDALPKT